MNLIYRLGSRKVIAQLPVGAYNIQFWFDYRAMKQNFLGKKTSEHLFHINTNTHTQPLLSNFTFHMICIQNIFSKFSQGSGKNKSLKITFELITMTFYIYINNDILQLPS